LGAWSAANCTLTANSITSPEGVTNSFKITENSAASTQHRVSLGSIGGSSATYTMSAYVKNSSGTRMAYIDMGPVTAHFNFSTETIYSAQGTADWEDAGDGWYRIWVTSNSAISVVTAFAGLSVNNNETYSGDGSSAIEFYGIQLEAGSYATSYIPTYGTSVTRNGDNASQTLTDDILDVDYNQGTLFFEAELKQTAITRCISIESSFWTTSSVRLELTPSSGTFACDIVNAGVGSTGTTIYLSSLSIGDTIKGAVSWNNGVTIVSANGQSIVGTSPVMTTKINKLYLNRLGTFGGAGNFVANEFKQVLISSNVFSEAELNDLTTI